jgi:hypothetical protein
VGFRGEFDAYVAPRYKARKQSNNAQFGRRIGSCPNDSAEYRFGKEPTGEAVALAVHVLEKARNFIAQLAKCIAALRPLFTESGSIPAIGTDLLEILLGRNPQYYVSEITAAQDAWLAFIEDLMPNPECAGGDALLQSIIALDCPESDKIEVIGEFDYLESPFVSLDSEQPERSLLGPALFCAVICSLFDGPDAR